MKMYVVYDNLDQKMEEMWCCLYSNLTPEDKDNGDVEYDDTLDEE
jgi:hypothetical protein